MELKQMIIFFYEKYQKKLIVNFFYKRFSSIDSQTVYQAKKIETIDCRNEQVKTNLSHKKLYKKI